MNRSSIFHGSKSKTKLQPNDLTNEIKHTSKYSSNQLRDNLIKRMEELSSIKKFQNTPKVTLCENNKQSKLSLKSRAQSSNYGRHNRN